MSNFFNRLKEVEQSLPAFSNSRLFDNWTQLTGKCVLKDLFFYTDKNSKESLRIRLENAEHEREFVIGLPGQYEDITTKGNQFKLAKLKYILQRLANDKEQKGSTQSLFEYVRKSIGSEYDYSIKENFYNDRIYHDISSLTIIKKGNEIATSEEFRKANTSDDVPF